MKRAALAFVTCAFVCPATATAHVLDQYLQVAQLTLAPDGVGVELRLIPGVQVADRVFAAIDSNGDGRIAPAEAEAHARAVMHELTLAVDGRRVPLTLVGAQFPSRSELQDGVGVIRLELAAQVSLMTEGRHRIAMRNDYWPEIGVYLVNVLVPKSASMTVARQTRDPLQHELQLDVDIARAKRGLWARLRDVLSRI